MNIVLSYIVLGAAAGLSGYELIKSKGKSLLGLSLGLVLVYLIAQLVG